jgi:hypothetical protein
MKIKTKAITIYYIALVCVLALQSIQTVFQLSQTIGFGQKISHLQQQKNILNTKKTQLTQNYYQLSSISMIDQEEKNFRPITSPIVITANSSVASR